MENYRLKKKIESTKNNYKIWWYINRKTKISPTQNTYFNKKYR